MAISLQCFIFLTSLRNFPKLLQTKSHESKLERLCLRHITTTSNGKVVQTAILLVHSAKAFNLP